ncbi:MAG: twin-arginine translocase subunit TatC, partial [Chloroflexi bacterium]|nr:twin-arginine translocase subunit TatC [Chloroflexota bacterium]
GFFARQRRAWIVISFVLGAVITPTFDPINQSMVAGPFIVLYELGILLSRLAARKSRRRRPAVS